MFDDLQLLDLGGIVRVGNLATDPSDVHVALDLASALDLAENPVGVIEGDSGDAEE